MCGKTFDLRKILLDGRFVSYMKDDLFLVEDIKEDSLEFQRRSDDYDYIFFWVVLDGCKIRFLVYNDDLPRLFIHAPNEIKNAWFKSELSELRETGELDDIIKMRVYL